MIKIMGGRTDSEPFQMYMNLVIKGFLIARKYHEHVVNIVKLMFSSGLPCFMKNSIVNLEDRFKLQKSEIEAAKYMKDIILHAADNWTTNWYDKIQWIQQKIYH
jgi:phosphatidylinositol 4-kinase